MSNVPISTLQTILERVPAFAHLSSEDLSWLASKAKPFHCSVGQQLLVSDRIPEYFYVVVEGKGRVLHSDPSLRRPVTLAYSQPGDLIGWSGLARRFPCEWITAAQPMKLIGFESSVFYELEDRSEKFRHWLDTSNSPAELISVLTPSLRSRPHAEPQEREILRRLVSSMQMISARDLRNIPQDSEYRWYWNSYHADFDLVAGTPVDIDVLKQIPVGYPLRLIRVHAEHWDQEMRPPLEAPPPVSQPNNNDLWANDRYSDLLLEPSGELTTASSTDQPSFNWRGKKIPFVEGVTSLEQTLACLEMLTKYYNVPFRKDIIERVAKESVKSHKPSLHTLGNLSTLWVLLVL